MTFLFIFIAILFFGVLVAVHEAGHFCAAKACGVRVNEFSIGMGPAILKKQRGETLYSLRLIPFGGFCAMSGEDEESDDPRAFTSQSAWKRLIILAAGSFMNFLLGLLIVIVLYSGAEAFNAPVLAGFMEGCPYEGEEAFQVGDRFIRINGKRVYMYYDIGDLLAKGSNRHDIVIKRGNERIRYKDMELVPLEYEGQSRKMYGFLLGYEEATLLVKLRYSWGAVVEFARMVWWGLGELFSGNVGVSDLSGPVGIVDMMADTATQAETVSAGLFDIFYFGAFIAVNLAIMNMLPIPAVDGGRIFFLIVSFVIEKIIGRKLNPKYEGYIHAAGLILLLALMAFVMFNDVFKLIGNVGVIEWIKGLKQK